MYSDLYLQKRSRVPSYLIALALIMVTGLSTFFFFSSSSTPTRASKKTVKQQEVVNLAARQLGVYWESEAPDKGWIIYGENPSQLSQIALDERDTSENKTDSVYHFAMLKNLKADTTYYYKIVSNNELISAQGNEPFSIRTTREMLPASATKPAYGKVVQPNSEPAQRAIVLIRYKDAYPLVTLSGSTGEWLMPLQGLMSKNDGQPSILQSTDMLSIQIIDEGMTTSIDTLVSNASPLPQTVMLGKDYKFLDESQVLPAFNQREQPKPSTNSKQYEVAINFPRDGAVIPGSQPLIRGVGVPGNDVVININSNPPFSAKTTVDSKGDWRVSIPGSVLAGNYNLIMTTEDGTGKKVGEKRTFSIAKSGEQVLRDATGSATLRPTRSVSPTKAISPTKPATTISPTTNPLNITPTLSATLSATPTLTATDSATISATLSPTTFIPVATPTVMLYATATPPPPVSGVSFIPYIFAGLGMIVAGAGLILLI